jgi:drug/metabolite transporter (DMT)-like permease
MLIEPDFHTVDTLGWLAFLNSGALANGLGYIAWYAALRRLPASPVSIGSLLVPAVGCWRRQSSWASSLGGAKPVRSHSR